MLHPSCRHLQLLLRQNLSSAGTAHQCHPWTSGGTVGMDQIALFLASISTRPVLILKMGKPICKEKSRKIGRVWVDGSRILSREATGRAAAKEVNTSRRSRTTTNRGDFSCMCSIFRVHGWTTEHIFKVLGDVGAVLNFVWPAGMRSQRVQMSSGSARCSRL